MTIKDEIYKDNYFINNPVKFYVNPKKFRDSLVAVVEVLKIFLAKLGLLKWSFNERLIERPFVFQNLPKSGRVLDIGCSDSIMPIEIAGLGYETYGNDPRGYPFSYPGFKFIKGDALKLNFPERYFDCITCISVLEHVGLSMDYSGQISGRKDKMLAEKIKKMLKKKGKFIITLPFGTKRVLENQHTRIYDSEEIKLLFSGFKKLEERYFYQKGSYWIESTAANLEKMTRSKFEETVAMFVFVKS